MIKYKCFAGKKVILQENDSMLRQIPDFKSQNGLGNLKKILQPNPARQKLTICEEMAGVCS